jgi:hypothetical protein
VRIEPSGWGTKVTLTAEAPDPPPTTPSGGSDLAIEHDDAGLQDLTPVVKRSWWARLRRRREPVEEVAVVEDPPAPPAPPPAAVLDGERAQAALTGVLDTLGAAHHRPFSRP